MYQKDKEINEYIETDFDTFDYDSDILFTNKFKETPLIVNCLPINHTILHYTKHVFKVNSKSKVEFIIDEYENIMPKKYFTTTLDFTSDIHTIRNEINMLVSLLD